MATPETLTFLDRLVQKVYPGTNITVSSGNTIIGRAASTPGMAEEIALNENSVWLLNSDGNIESTTISPDQVLGRNGSGQLGGITIGDVTLPTLEDETFLARFAGSTGAPVETPSTAVSFKRGSKRKYGAPYTVSELLAAVDSLPVGAIVEISDRGDIPLLDVVAKGSLTNNNGTIFAGTTNAAVVRVSGGLIKATWFDTVGDGVADDTAALTACATECARVRDAGGRPIMWLPHCTAYKITSGLVIGHGIAWKQEAPIRTSGLGFTALTIGGSTLSQEIHLNGIWVEHTAIATAWADTAATEGVRIINKSTGTISITKVHGFYVGCTYFGDSNGFVYTNTTLGIFRDNKYQLVLSSQGSGFCNENKFFGGEFWVNSTRIAIPHVGILITAVAGHRYQNGNVFFGPSFEIGEPTPLPADPADEINTPVLVEYGMRNAVLRYRAELTGNQFCKVLNNSDIYIEGMAAGGKIVDQSTNADSVNYGGWSRDRLKGLFPFAIFNLAERFIDQGGGLASFLGMSISRSGMATEEPIEIYSGFSLSANKSAVAFVDGFHSVGVMVDTSVTKRIAISRAVLAGEDPADGRTVVRAYDAGGTNISATGITGYGVVQAPGYLSTVGCINMVQDISVIRVTADVKRIWVGVSGVPTTSLVLYADPTTQPPQTYGFLPRKSIPRRDVSAGTDTLLSTDAGGYIHVTANCSLTLDDVFAENEPVAIHAGTGFTVTLVAGTASLTGSATISPGTTATLIRIGSATFLRLA